MNLSDLADDGDTLELDDGRTLRLRVKSDDIDPFREFDSYGKITPFHRSSYDGRHVRPAGFNGNAGKLYPANNGDAVWWQPPDDGPRRGTPEFEQMQKHVLDLLAFGMFGVVLELLDGKDAYGQPIVTRVASLRAIEPFPTREYVQEIVRALHHELMGSES